jgi:hypothetical protein
LQVVYYLLMVYDLCLLFVNIWDYRDHAANVYRFAGNYV